MQAVILAAGDGTRMADMTGGGPKCLLDVQGKPFLYHQIGWLVESGATDIIVWANERDKDAMFDAMRPHKDVFPAQVLTEKERSGTGGAVMALQEARGRYGASRLWYEYVLVMGDVMLDEPIPQWRLAPQHVAGMLVTKNAGPEDKRNVAVAGPRVADQSISPVVPLPPEPLSVVAYDRSGGRDYVDCGVWWMRSPLDWTGIAIDGEQPPWDLEDGFWPCSTGAACRPVGAVVTDAYQWHTGNPAGYERMCKEWRPRHDSGQ